MGNIFVIFLTAHKAAYGYHYPHHSAHPTGHHTQGDITVHQRSHLAVAGRTNPLLSIGLAVFLSLSYGAVTPAAAGVWGWVKRVVGKVTHADDAMPVTGSSRGLTPAIAQHLSPAHAALLKTFDAAALPTSRIRVTKTGVKHFAKDFRAGMDNPNLYKTSMDPKQQQLLAAYYAAPKERRIFIAGSGKDTPQIHQIEAALKDKYTVFFYEFCREASGALCWSESVGAAFASADQALFFNTPAAAASKYLPFELMVAMGKEGWLFAPGELVAAARNMREGTPGGTINGVNFILEHSGQRR